ncbi:MAG: hypothetical protein IPN86_07860 [Saprospiraceae bacterium]|nr:hypothetical protein [Saprospiraceae bacterium]
MNLKGHQALLGVLLCFRQVSNELNFIMEQFHCFGGTYLGIYHFSNIIVKSQNTIIYLGLADNGTTN